MTHVVDDEHSMDLFLDYPADGLAAGRSAPGAGPGGPAGGSMVPEDEMAAYLEKGASLR